MAIRVFMEIGNEPHQVKVNGDDWEWDADIVHIFKGKEVIAQFDKVYVVRVIEEGETPQEEKAWKLP